MPPLATAPPNAPFPRPPNDAYLHWDASGVEEIKGDEEAKAHQIADTMNEMQKHNFDKHRHAFRATHVKTQGLVKGTLPIPSGLSSHLSQGLFAQPGTYPVASRYPQRARLPPPDTEPGPRGMSIKIFNADGERLGTIGNQNLSTQDFFFNNAPMIDLTDVDTCLETMQLREKHVNGPTRLALALKMGTDAIKQHTPEMLPNKNMISLSMCTQYAFRFREYHGHTATFPVLPEMKDKSAEAISSSGSYTQLSDWLFDYLKGALAKHEVKNSKQAPHQRIPRPKMPASYGTK